MDGMRAVSIDTTDPGKATVVIDGEDVSSSIAGLQLRMSEHEPPELILFARPAGINTFEGYAVVRVADDVPDPGPAAEAFLAAIDPETLQREALARLDLAPGPTGTTEAILRQLREWASGRA